MLKLLCSSCVPEIKRAELKPCVFPFLWFLGGKATLCLQMTDSVATLGALSPVPMELVWGNSRGCGEKEPRKLLKPKKGKNAKALSVTRITCAKGLGLGAEWCI